MGDETIGQSTEVKPSVVSVARCKFTCYAVVPDDRTEGHFQVNLSAQYDPDLDEDKRFSTATPSGQFSAFINNPNLVGFFQVGKCYYIDVTPCGEPG